MQTGKTTTIKQPTLTSHEYEILKSGDWLTDAHIIAAHSLVCIKYPNQNGLQNTLTLAYNLKWESTGEDMVQVLHDKDHWVCASTVHLIVCRRALRHITSRSNWLQ